MDDHTHSLATRAPEGVAPVGNPVRGPFNALFFRVMDGYLHRLLGNRKERLFEDLPERIVELGPGTGPNFRYYRPGSVVIGAEPNPHMHPPLRRSAADAGISLELLPRPAEDTGLEPDSVEAVVCTLVLCTVVDPKGTLAEVRRILRPGGRFIFMEHVIAPEASGLRGLQHLVHRPWKWCFEGCHVTRDTASTLEAAGFSSVQLERYRLPSPFLPFNTQIAGVAVK